MAQKFHEIAQICYKKHRKCMHDFNHIIRSYLAHLSYRYKVYHGHSNSHINRDAFKHKK